MKTANFGAFCPHCGVGTMAASALFSAESRFFLFYITSEGSICFDGICSNCQGQFQIQYSIMGLLFQCPTEEDKVTPKEREQFHIPKKVTVL